MWVQWMDIALTIVKRLTFKGFSFLSLFSLAFDYQFPNRSEFRWKWGGKNERKKTITNLHRVWQWHFNWLINQSTFCMFTCIVCVCSAVYKRTFFESSFSAASVLFLFCHLRTEKKTCSFFFIWFVRKPMNDFIEHREQSWINPTIHTSGIYCRITVAVFAYCCWKRP